MAGSFDPWHIWLGVSPANQPPNHYRLLGIRLFEHDEDVIDTAASRQSLALREHATGEHAEQAEELLTQIATARACLLNRKHRKKYDHAIRGATSTQDAPAETHSAGPAEPGYHLWLGIAPSQQPPNHYDLLGIEVYESSLPAIEAATQRQSGYLREVSSGPNRKLSQKLLNDVSAARRCLIDAEKKQAYDEKLRLLFADAAKEEPNTSPNVGGDSGSAATASATIRTRTTQPAAASPEAADGSAKRDKLADEKRKTRITIGASSCGGLLLLAGICYALMGSGDDEEPVAVTGAESGESPGSADNTMSKELGSTDMGLLAHWTFDEKNPDWAKNAAGPLTLTHSGKPKFVDGPFGSAVQLDGKDDYLEMPTGALEARAGTIAFWVRREARTVPGADPLISTAGKGTQFSLRLTNPGHVKCAIGVEPHEIEAPVAFEPGVWYHVALAWGRDGEASLFCNARQVGSVADVGQIGLPGKLELGHATSAGTAVFARVSFDEVRCFKRALDTKELSRLIGAASTKLKDPLHPSAISEPILVATKPDTPPEKLPAEKTGKPKATAKNPTTTVKKKATPKPPAPPPERVVIFPGGTNDVACSVWKNIDATELSGLTSVIEEKVRPSYRRLKLLAAGTKERLAKKSGQLVRGYLVPPLTGTYTFQTKFGDKGRFQLSSSQSPTPMSEIKNGQKVELSGNETYYFELLHLNEAGDGLFNVGWKLPDGSEEKTIPGKRLRWTGFPSSFTVLPLAKVETTGSLTAKRVANTNQFQLAGDARAESTVTIEFKTDMTQFSAFKLDAIFDEKLNPKGPGLGTKGKFALKEATLAYQEPGSTEFIPVALEAPFAHAGIASRLVDDKESTEWSVAGRDGLTTSVVLVPEKRLDVKPRTLFRFTVKQTVPMGLFQVSGTSSTPSQQIARLKTEMEKVDQPFQLFVNLGGGTWTDPTSKVRWVTSRTYNKEAKAPWGHSGGKPKTASGFKPPFVCLQSAQEGISAFRVDVPNGGYDVVLYFSENWEKQPGKRVFSVQTESSPPVIVGPVQLSGLGKPFTLASSRTRRVIVKDGRLDILFKKAPGATLTPILNAVAISQ